MTSTPVPERDPSWSPDGIHLIYAARTGGRAVPDLRRQRRRFRTDQLTTQAAGSADRSPVWSPDGSRIAFVSNRAGGFPELYLMFADGTGVVRLTTNSLIDANRPGLRTAPSSCSSVLRERHVGPVHDRRGDAGRGEPHRHDGQEFDPTWSPDGTRIAFAAFEVGQGNIDIWVMNADGPLRCGSRRRPGRPLAHWQPIPA